MITSIGVEYLYAVYMLLPLMYLLGDRMVKAPGTEGRVTHMPPLYGFEICHRLMPRSCVDQFTSKVSNIPFKV